MGDEPTSLLALGIAGLVFLERAFDRIMQFVGRRRENGGGHRPALSTARGAVGNGLKATNLRLDKLEADIKDIGTECGNLWSKVSEVNALAQRLDERTGGKPGKG